DAEGMLITVKSRATQIPLLLSDQYSLTFQRDPNAKGDSSSTKRVGVLLPGGAAGLSVQGFAVSGGTQHPEQAYALAQFLTTRVELINRAGGIPARKSLIGASSGDQSILPGISPEDRAFLDQALAKAIPGSELRYT